MDLELLREHSEGLIVLSGCLAGKIPSLLSSGEYAEAVKYARTMSEIFGKDNFYIELQNHGMNEQIQLLPQLVRLAEECDLPLVATNDCHYLRRENAGTQAVLMCIFMIKQHRKGTAHIREPHIKIQYLLHITKMQNLL